jgi:hypothetical protein
MAVPGGTLDGMMAATAPADEYTIGQAMVLEPDVTLIAVPPICMGSGRELFNTK